TKHVKVGDKVSQFDPICDVQIIDKLHLNLNEVCKVGQPLVDIEVNNVVKSSSSAKVESLNNVRRIARENIINLHDVSGSGKDGRVLHEDIQRYLAGQSQSKSQDKMTESQLIPHFVLSEEIDMSKLVEFRQSINEKLIKLNNIKITYLPFFIKVSFNYVERLIRKCQSLIQSNIKSFKQNSNEFFLFIYRYYKHSIKYIFSAVNHI
ncbi:unnamed protein product, partial [Trichobilharzia regenti]